MSESTFNALQAALAQRLADFDFLVDQVIRLGRQIARESAPAATTGA